LNEGVYYIVGVGRKRLENRVEGGDGKYNREEWRGDKG
jgi:hypothetical protein